MQLIPTLELLLQRNGVTTQAAQKNAFVLVREHARGVEVLSLYSYTTTKKVRQLLTAFGALFKHTVVTDGEWGHGDGACFIIKPISEGLPSANERR